MFQERHRRVPTASPPFITFGWGKTVFKGACTSLTCTYKLFQPDGEPVRADVKLSLTQAEPPTKGQNPTTRSTAGFGMHTVRDGDTLPSISFAAYGDATKWRLIAEANGVDNPLHLSRGPLALTTGHSTADAGDPEPVPGARRRRRRAESTDRRLDPKFREAMVEVKVVELVALLRRGAGGERAGEGSTFTLVLPLADPRTTLPG